MTGLDDVIDEWKLSGKLPQNFRKEQALRLTLLQEAVKELDVRYGPEGYA